MHAVSRHPKSIPEDVKAISNLDPRDQSGYYYPSIAKLQEYTVLVVTLIQAGEHLLQGCGSGSGLDPDSESLWIRIRIGNPDPGARKLRNFCGKNALFSY
jgi:hypothetical protein